MGNKKFTFIKIGNQVASGWYAQIDSDEALQAHLKLLAHRVVRNWKLIKDSPDYKEGHCFTWEAGMYKWLLSDEMERTGQKSMSMPESLNFMEDLATKAVKEIFAKNGIVYAGRNGGCRPNTELLSCESILRTIKKDRYVFPISKKKDFKITKWPKGQHFYILENGSAIVLEGKSKWNTIGAAEETLKRHTKHLGYHYDPYL